MIFYVGIAIPELSKLLMHDFHNNYMLNKYDKNKIPLILPTSTACFTKLMLEMLTKYEKQEDLKYFDTSGFAENNKCFSKETKINK